MASQTIPTPHFKQLRRICSVTLEFSPQAMALLSETTTLNDGSRVSNYMLFQDLLSRIILEPQADTSDHGQLSLKPGQATYSEPKLTEQWQIGRTRLRRLLDRMQKAGLIYTNRAATGSVMSFPALKGWRRSTSAD